MRLVDSAALLLILHSAAGFAVTARPNAARPALALAPAPTVAAAPAVATHSNAGAARTCANGAVMLFGKNEEPVPALRSSLFAIGWLSWWTQAILSTVSSVLFLFANSVSGNLTPLTFTGRALAIAGLACAIGSTLWTLSYARLGRRLGRKPETKPSDAASSAMGIVKFGVTLNMIGMALCILSAFAITGTLAAKALTMSQAATLGVAASPVQAIDVLIVQANTNTLAAHFGSLCGFLRLRRRAEICADAKA